MKKRILSLLLALVLAFSIPLGAFATEAGTYPVEWDLTDLFADKAAWEAAYAEAASMLDGFESMRGTLNTADGVWAFVEYSEAFADIYYDLYLYADLSYCRDLTDAEAMTMYAMVDALTVAYSQAAAFADPEIFALSLEEREAIFSDARFAATAYAYEGYVDPEAEPLSEETTSALAAYTPSLSQITTIYDIFVNTELPAVPFSLDGEVIALDDYVYTSIIYGDYDREVKAAANQALLTQPLPYMNTLTAIYQAKVSAAWASAQVAEYESSREAALDASDVPVEVYDLMLEAAHAGAPEMRRYLTLHREALGLDEQYPFDTAAYVSSYRREVGYDEAVDEVRDALSILGEDYIALYDQMVEAGHIDVYPGDAKMSGAFEASLGNGQIPYVLFNYTGSATDVSTIAHELGHALYDLIADAAQPMSVSVPTIFTQEVASTTNEILYYLYMMDNAADEDERLYYLESAIQMFMGTFFYQAAYAEFEDSAHQIVESGASLDADTLNTLYAGIMDTLRGDAIVTYDGYGAQWALIPHFFQSSYYVYQYATSVCYAAAIARNIYQGDEIAKEAYFNFLSAGASADPAALLAIAGIDITAPETYQAAVDFFSEWVDEYAALIGR